MFRQGDVLLIPIGSKQAAKTESGWSVRDLTPEDGRIVLAEGEATGHAHVIRHPGARLLVKSMRTGYMSSLSETILTVADGPALLVHEEHLPIELAPGAYRVVRQREYDPTDGARRVAD